MPYIQEEQCLKLKNQEKALKTKGQYSFLNKSEYLIYFTHHIIHPFKALWFCLILMLMAFVHIEMSTQVGFMFFSGQCSTSTWPYLSEEMVA